MFRAVLNIVPETLNLIRGIFDVNNAAAEERRVANQMAVVEQTERNLQLENRRLEQKNIATLLGFEQQKLGLMEKKLDLDAELSFAKLRKIERVGMESLKNMLEVENKKIDLVEKQLNSETQLKYEKLKIERLEVENTHQYWMTTLQPSVFVVALLALVIIITILSAFVTRTPMSFIFGGWGMCRGSALSYQSSLRHL